MDMKTSPLSLLKDPTLFKTDALINGQWIKGSCAAHPHLRYGVKLHMGNSDVQFDNPDRRVTP